MTGKERKTLLMHRKMEIQEKKNRMRSVEIDQEIEEEIKQIEALKTLVMTRRFSYMQLLKSNHIEKAKKLGNKKSKNKPKFLVPITSRLALPEIGNNSKTARIISQPKTKKQEDLVECYKRLKYLEKFDKKELDASFLIEKGDAVQEEYKIQNEGAKVLRRKRYQSRKNLHRLNKFSKNEL
ncbi:unnamed protein product [Moneuplotes crassus]|uniref:Uncharacterized protein n=1 Tax=Euplotes crassus TaxID=5936 RepID=A0AAD1Y8Z9_EUPCR|nr:unnamed protein product [Moneuplotes crassus]